MHWGPRGGAYTPFCFPEALPRPDLDSGLGQWTALAWPTQLWSLLSRLLLRALGFIRFCKGVNSNGKSMMEVGAPISDDNVSFGPSSLCLAFSLLILNKEEKWSKLKKSLMETKPKRTLMLGKIEGGRRRGPQRMRWLGSITDLMDMSLSNSRR